jgi:hypothetical protein
MTASSSELERLLRSAAVTLPLTQNDLSGNPEKCSVCLAEAKNLFPGAQHERAALAGLLLRLECWPESHNVAQEITSIEGSYWHAILHRMEPDSANAGYWFRRVGKHPIFPDLQRRAGEILQESGPKHWRLKATWDPLLFVEWCDEARQKGGEAERAAEAIQMAEWDLLFEWCAAKPEARSVSAR